MDIKGISAQTPYQAPVAAEKTEGGALPIDISEKLSGSIGTDANMQQMEQLQQMSQAQKAGAAPELGSKAYWTAQAKHMTDFFARVSVDTADGGYYTHIDSAGNVSNQNEKFLMPTSRQVWAYSANYMMSGDKKSLELAKHGVDFILAHHMRTDEQGEVYWMQQVDKKGNLVEGADKAPLMINEQTYGLTGMIEYYKVTKDPKILDIIHRGHEFITNHYTDSVNGGFFDSVDPATFEPAHTKSYNSTIYPATSALLEMADIAEGEWKSQVNGQIKEMADLFVKNFPDPKTGFIKENFTENWQEDWRGWQKQPEGSIGVTGHNTQGALFLLRAERQLSKEGLISPEESQKYKAAAKAIMNSILDRGYDKEHGGWYDVFVRETAKNMWHTNKAFWQQEEGYLATLAMSKIDPDPKYAQASDQTLKFWDKYFIDREVGGDRMTVAADGASVADPKGGPGKSSYHSTEMARLAMEIGEWS
jgi:mannobiose 2-epimerase